MTNSTNRSAVSSVAEIDVPRPRIPGRIGAPAVIVGLEQNGLGIARALGREGVRVIGVHDSLDRPSTATRFAEVVRCDDLRGVGLIDTLVGIATQAAEPPVLIATMDRTVNLVAEHRHVLDRHFLHSLPPPAVIERLMNKAATDAFAREQGFLVPRTLAIQTEDEFRRCLPELTFPCILKPQVKTVDFVAHTPSKAFLIRDLAELERTYQLVAQWEPEIVIQEWVPGSDDRLVFCLYYFNRQGQPLAWFEGRKIRQHIPYCGTACSAEPWRDEWVKDAGIRFFQAAGYSGYGAIEFKVDAEGRYHLIEPTVGRTEHLFALAASNGVNLPYIGYCDVVGVPAPAWSLQKRSRIYLDWRRDMRAARFYVEHGELTWPQWLRSVSGLKQYALFAWDDPVPFARHAGRRTKQAFGRVGRRFTRAASEARALLAERLGGGAPAASVRREPAAVHEHVEAAVDWLCAAQDATGVGGVARGYSVSRRSRYPVGWQQAYPETTGYIIPTIYDVAERWSRPDLRNRALQMATWEASVQLPNGGFPGSTVDKRAPAVVFNTGMILMGMCRAYSETRDERFLESASRGTAFLLQVQSPDGAWRRFTTPSGVPMVHAYDLLVCKGPLAAAKLLNDARIVAAVRRNLDFSLTLQQENGWLASNGITPRHHVCPPTHTIGYAAQGLLECGLDLGEPRYVSAATRMADAVERLVQEDGFLAGRLDQNWMPGGNWCCLTGNAQLSIVWWTLFRHTGDVRYRTAASKAMRYVKCRQDLSSKDLGVRGGIAGSSPMEGEYGRHQYLNWAAKFFIDALLLEEQLHPTPRDS
jgi:predicted ATP-grasp superfamily ATP-dependent carboligase